MRILLVLPEFGPGGAERVASLLANEWAKRGQEVSVTCFWGRDEKTFYSLHHAVDYKALDFPNIASPSPFQSRVRRYHRFRQHIKNKSPDVVISFLTRPNVLTLLASRGLGVPVVVAERNHPKLRKVAPGWRFLRNMLYPRADALVVQTEQVLQHYSHIAPKNTIVIPNPVRGTIARKAAPRKKPTKKRGRIVAAGRLVHQKGFDLLLEAFSNLAREYPLWELEIWGEGEDRANLEDMRDRLGLAGRVRFPGVTSDLRQRMRDGDLFVLSSRYEGFPNVLLEAMASGLPVVGFDCPYGPSEIVKDGENGVLVDPEDVDGLARAIDRLILNPELRAELSANAVGSLDSYRLGNVLEQWNNLLLEVTGAAPMTRGVSEVIMPV